MAEIPFRIGSSVKWISGISEDTTCRDILIAVLRSEALLDCDESEVHHRFALVETWRYRTSSSRPDNNCRISYCTTIKYFSKPQLRSSENLFSSAVVKQNTATNILLASINFPTAASLWVWVQTESTLFMESLFIKRGCLSVLWPPKSVIFAFLSPSYPNVLYLLCKNKKFPKCETWSYLGLKARISRTEKLVLNILCNIYS